MCIIFIFRRQHMTAGWGSGGGGTAPAREAALAERRAPQELFELLERVQCSRLDDQRCVLPPYTSQVNIYYKTASKWSVPESP